jgi:hypothetical protein
MSLKFNYLNICVFFLFMATSSSLTAQSPWIALSKQPSTLHLEEGIHTFKAGPLRLKLVNSSQTMAGLSPQTLIDFDFTPSDSLKVRSSNGLYHLGDINLAVRSAGELDWTKFSTATSRKRVKALTVVGNILAAAELNGTMAAGIPLQIRRYWELQNGQLMLRFELKNNTNQVVEIGALGIPVIFNNILEGKTLEQSHAKNVFYDPYIGRDAGYLQVTRLSGQAPSLIVIPYGNTPFEAYNPLLEDKTPKGIAFEGFYEWMVYSKAYAEREWKNADPWNQATSGFLKPGETKSFGLKFILAGSPKDIETKLMENNRPVAMAVPGYVLPQDVEGKLFLHYSKKVKAITVEPKNALTVTKGGLTTNGWMTYGVKGTVWGRVRLSIAYEDGLVQTINYKVIKSESEVVKDYGNFLMTKQWFDQPDTIFKRSPSVITYDEERKRQVTQDNRAWIAGLSDEGGAGGWLGAMMKQLVLPNKMEIDKLKRFADTTLFGQIQVAEGPQKFGVKKSLFYYAPDSLPKNTYDKNINFKTWSAWPVKEAGNLGRSYNYPHVAAAHWTLYRLARNYRGLVRESDWKKYLEYAYETSLAMVRLAPYYAQFGQMEGTIFLLILKDLKSEGLIQMADTLEREMKKRANHWSVLQYPFGSEMPWDSTGQEEVYMWSSYFGYKEKARVTLDAILAYTPVLPHWAYNGNARRYWDFLYGGKLSRIERMVHHYGSALNAIPLLKDYRDNPTDFYLLRAGYGGLLGSISNITQEGFAPAAFHAYPSTLKNDGLSGDFGSGFFGYAVNTSTYILNHKEFGWLSFGGNLSKSGSWIKVKITTAAQSAVFIAPAGLWITLDAGKIREIAYNVNNGKIRLSLAPANVHTPDALIRLEQPVKISGTKIKVVKRSDSLDHGAYRIELRKDLPTVILIDSKTPEIY